MAADQWRTTTSLQETNTPVWPEAGAPLVSHSSLRSARCNRKRNYSDYQAADSSA
jgi:hypothetical protein